MDLESAKEMLRFASTEEIIKLAKVLTQNQVTYALLTLPKEKSLLLKRALRENSNPSTAKTNPPGGKYTEREDYSKDDPSLGDKMKNLSVVVRSSLPLVDQSSTLSSREKLLSSKYNITNL